MLKRWIFILFIFISSLCSAVSVKSSPSALPSYPTTINVLFVRQNSDGSPLLNADGNYILDGSSPNPRQIAFESDYLPNIVQQEMSNAALLQAKEVQSIAARNFAWQKIAYGDNPPNSRHLCFAARTCDVTNSTDHQAYYPSIATSADYTAVQNTSNLFLAWSNQGSVSDTPSFTEFSKGHPGSFTVAGNTTDYPYLERVYDPIQPAYVAGHGRGMSQDGTLRWERGNSRLDYTGVRYPFWNRDQILAHYYTSVQLRHTNGIVYWGDYRWNALTIDRQIFRTNTANAVTVEAQNTGVRPWEADTKLSAYWVRCQHQSTTICDWAKKDPPINRQEDTISAVAPGAYTARTLYLTPPTGLYLNGTDYDYYLQFDLRRPNGQYFKDSPWHEQEWLIQLENKPPPPRPSTPPCTPGSCPTPQRSVTVSWIKDANPDGVTFVWTQTSSSGVVTGETTNTALTINLERGENTLTAKAQDVTPLKTQSDNVVLARFLYDPDPPIIDKLTILPEWSNAASINLEWSSSDALSGIASYTLEQQIGTGTWTTLLSATQATSYQVTNLINNNDYTFRLTVRDKAGNTTQQTRIIKIDRDPPSSALITPTGTLAKTWTIINWTSSFNRAPIRSFAIDRLINGTWQPLYAVIEPQSNRILFEGNSNMTYALRIRTIDEAGNQEAGSMNAQITFTTGSDKSGLFKSSLPILLKDTTIDTTSQAAPSSTTTTAYPLPGQ